MADSKGQPFVTGELTPPLGVRDSDETLPELDMGDTKASESSTKQTTEPEYPPFKRVVPILFALFFSLFLVALDRTIIGTAIPTITDHFNSLGDVGWYASAYLLTSCSFALLIGRVYTFYNPKLVYLACLVTFELGSAICGAAPTSKALIVGRAIAGLGGAGLFQGGIIIIVNIVPLHKRPAVTGFFGMIFGVSSVVGPLLGGVFTEKISWRWCFYINLPTGGVVLVLLMVFLHIPGQATRRTPTTLAQKLDRLDPIGTSLFLPSIVCLLLALQWGGLTYHWSNARIIFLLVLSAVLSLGFIVIQRLKGPNGTVPPHIFLNRSIQSGMFFALCTGGSMMTFVTFLPIYFQAIHGASAVHSGILTIPLVLGLVLASITAGFLTKKIGYYAPWLLVSSTLAPIGAGLITTFSPTTTTPKFIGCEFLYGIGLGLGMQQPSVAAQTVLSRADVPTGASLIFLAQTLGGTVFVSVANNILDTRLAAGLRRIPDIGDEFSQVVGTGATELRKVVSSDLLPRVLDAYSAALRQAFYVGLAMSCAGIVGAVTMEWRSVKEVKVEEKQVGIEVKGSATVEVGEKVDFKAEV